MSTVEGAPVIAASPSEPRSDPGQVAEALFGAITRGDVDAVRALYRSDTVIWHNYDGVAQDPDANLAVLGWLVRNVSDIRYEEIRRQVFPGGFVQQHVLRGRAPSGAALEVPACMVVAVEDGRIVRIDEYFDSAHLAPLAQA
ncbi:MAG TPA: nuclear transport factor 2 family protein [Acidimicrobiales bacterium]|nr:nuclear transport factor 2 family protein [Acidimicrobiales bacterium]